MAGTEYAENTVTTVSTNPLGEPNEIEVADDLALLRHVTESTVDLFDLPHRSVSNVTVVPYMYLSWHNLNAYSVEDERSRCWNYCLEPDVEAGKREKHILKDAFGVANPGEVLAIMGASGAGKTSLLNVLTRRNIIGSLRLDGSVKVNGLHVTKQYMRKISAYIQQEDCFIGSLTVEEHLLFNARLRMSDRYSYDDQRKRVRQVMADLGLKGSADDLIGTRTRKGLSGGEKKRLSFASEILTSPPILLCDEPTSGLDSFLAFQVISVLRRLARKRGMTVVITIHQPPSQVFELFDRVYLMSEGRVAFCGSRADAASHWANVKLPSPLNFNPADHYISTLAVSDTSNSAQIQQVKMICDEFVRGKVGIACARDARSSERKNSSSESSQMGKWSNDEKDNVYKEYHASWLQQLRVLTWRNSRTILREPTLLKVQLMQSIIIAALTGFVYLGNTISQQQVMNINGSLFQLISNMAFMFQFSVVHHFCLELTTLYREHGSALYRLSSYFIAKNIAELPSYTLSAIVFSVILYWMSNMVSMWDAFFLYILVAVLVQNIAISIGYAMGCIFGSVSLAVAVMPIFVVPMSAFGGFFINQNSLPFYFQPLKYLSYFGYAFESLLANEWRTIREIPGCSNTTRCYTDGNAVVESLSFSVSHLYSNLAVLMAFIVVIRLMAYFGLYMRIKLRS